MHHVELLLDDASDAAVRQEWRALDEAGLPSQARHRSASNRPHVTLTMTHGWPGEDGLAEALAPLAALPLTCPLGAPTVFGAGPYVLVRALVTTEPLLALQRELAHRLEPLASDLLVPGRWVPHVTLARRMPAEQVVQALGLLGAASGIDVVLDAARHWDAGARRDEPLTAPRRPGRPA